MAISAILTHDEKITELEKFYWGCKNNPWGIFFELEWDAVLTNLEENGYEPTWDLIDRADKWAYHREEYSAGML